MDGGEEPTAIPTNIRLLLLLEELGRLGEPASSTEINERLGLPKPTAHRLCATLAEHGYLSREPSGRRFSPGPRLRALAMSVLASAPARAARLAVLGNLSEQIGETCNIATPDGDAMVYLERVEAAWPLRIELEVGAKVPLYCTAAGKLYLALMPETTRQRILNALDMEPKTEATRTTPEELAAELSQIREQDYSTDNEEFYAGMVCVAVPILDNADRLCATLSFHAPTQRMSLSDATSHVPALQAAARDLSEIMV